MTHGDAEDPFSFGKVSGANFNSPGGMMIRKQKSQVIYNENFKMPTYKR